MTAASALQPDYDEADPALCRRCQAFDIQAFSKNTTPWRGYRVSEIADSAASGCQFCSYLARGLNDAGFQIYSTKRDNSSDARWVHFRVLRAVGYSDSQSALDDTGLNITYLQVFDWNPQHFGPSDATPLLEFHVVADPGDPASISRDVVGRYTARDTSSQDLIDTIKSWIASCTEMHSECSLTLSGQRIATWTPLPTRCLKVTADPMAIDGICIRLVKTASMTGSYTTLSHRWPTPPKELQGATTSTNLADRLAGKEALESRLPRHFVDACILTLRLGFEYIWIDAVCIIQGAGDPAAMTDWAYEAGRMASYYQNSRLTIAGTYGDDAIGLFRAETHENSRPLIRLPYRARPGSTAPQPSFFYLIPSDCHFNQDYEDHVSRSDLLTRGWVTQEWVLSRRILCYTPTSAYFQCIEEFPHNEDGRVITIRQYGEGEADGDEASVKMLKRDLSSDLTLKKLNIRYDGADIYRIWSDVVATYSQRSLTRPETDKLMGLVGIANEFGRALVHKLGLTEAKSRIWVGGLWLADIFEGLLWEQVGHLPASAPRPSPDRYDAGRIAEVPSWSWASRRCAVSWPEPNRKRCVSSCEIMAVREAKAGQSQMATAATPAITEETGENWESLPIIGGHPDPDQALLVDPTKVFPVLCVRARLISILIRETFTDEEERQVAVKLSGYNGPGRWRKVAVLSSPGRICGWVSLDRDQNQGQTDASREPQGGQVTADNDETAGAARGRTGQNPPTSPLTAAGQQRVMPRQEDGDNGNRVEEQERETGRQATMDEEDLGRKVQALLVSTATHPRGGYPLGYTSLHHPVYKVLFLQRYPGDVIATESKFERIGIGRLFGLDVQRLFEDTEPQELQLF